MPSPQGSPLLLVALLMLVPACGLGNWPSTSRPDPPASPDRDPAPSIRIIDMASEAHRDPLRDELGVERGRNVGQWNIDRDNDGKLDGAEVFAQRIRKHTPSNSRSVVALDWEGRLTERLRADPATNEHRSAVEDLREALAIAKRARPNAEFGFYGLPRTQYWKRDELWRAHGWALQELLAEVDWIGQSVYPIYKTGDQAPLERQLAYIRGNVELALEIGRAVERPVYVWVTHRYHPTNSKYPFHLVEPDEFVAHVRAILDVEYEGHHVDGIIWWGGDSYYAKEGRIEVDGDVELELAKIHDQYLRLLVGAVRDFEKDNGSRSEMVDH